MGYLLLETLKEIAAEHQFHNEDIVHLQVEELLEADNVAVTELAHDVDLVEDILALTVVETLLLDEFDGPAVSRPARLDGLVHAPKVAVVDFAHKLIAQESWDVASRSVCARKKRKKKNYY